MTDALKLCSIGSSRAAPEQPTLLLLHGTGGDENDLLPLGRALLPGAALLSPRGAVLERGQPRFFRRLAEGVFDLEDLRVRTAELATFVREAAATYQLDAEAHRGGRLLEWREHRGEPDAGRHRCACRCRAAPADGPVRAGAPGRTFRAVPVLISAGRADPIVPRHWWSGSEYY